MIATNLTADVQALALVTGIIVICFGALFGALRYLFNKGIQDMKDAIKIEIKNFNTHCKLVSGNLHSGAATETKQRIYADEKLDKNFRAHGHKGLNDDGNKITI